MNNRNIFLTGGSGTLGNAILEQYGDKSQFTIFSRDPMRQMKTKAKHPDIRLVVGDVRDDCAVLRAMAGHDLVIHAAAMKHIPQAEHDPDACYEINVQGSRNVLDAALRHGIRDVVLISTDKACHPANVYGCSKMMMERLALSYIDAGMNVYLPRYGNVVDSTGSVVKIWRTQLKDGKPITITYPDMTRFWLSPQRAVDVIIESMNYKNVIYVPKLPALSILKLAQYTIDDDVEYKTMGLRPGEKIHEELMTKEESAYISMESEAEFLIHNTTRPCGKQIMNYSSDNPDRELTRKEIRTMLGLED